MTAPAPGYEYRDEFFDFVDLSSGRSAARFLAALDLGLVPQSVLDVGCGRGVWLRAWKERGVPEVLGLDGSYVDPARLHVDRAEFRATDLSRPFDLGRSFDLVQCLEVAEHLPPPSAEPLVASLVRHGDVVLFSAATPGQGGEQHLNERPPVYWAALFARHGFAAYDCVRPAVRGDAAIEPWYRYNALLYASARGAERLSAAARATGLAPGVAPPEVAPLGWRLRCAVLRALPRPLVHRLARLKHRVARRIPGGAR